MIKVGVIGLGMMGLTHLDVYTTLKDVKVVAISDIDADRLAGRTRAVGNIEGQASKRFDYAAVTQHNEGKKLIADANVDLVDICLPTPLHAEYAIAALQAGKHVLCEKPMARTAADARKFAEIAAASRGTCMIAMCMRWWPGWTWLREQVEKQSFGRTLSAHFRRVASHPGGAFYLDAAKCGGAILDLHIHDTDFIQNVFGVPKSVSTFGYTSVTAGIDHVVTRYEYPHVPLVVAEGSWAMSKGFPFTMQYAVNFERATAVFDLAAKNILTLYELGKEPAAVEIPGGMGYEREIEYFVDCLKNNKKPDVVTLPQAAESVRIIEAEMQSLQTGKPVIL